MFFPKILKYSEIWPFSVFPRCQFVYTHHAGRKQALQQNWQSSEKSQHFKENTIFNEHPVHMYMYVHVLGLCYHRFPALPLFFKDFFICIYAKSELCGSIPGF